MTNLRLFRCSIAAAALLVLTVFAGPAAHAASVEGRWLLVEETYGNGGSNLRRGKPALTLSFSREDGRLTAVTRLTPDAREQPWPALTVQDAPAQMTIEEIVIGPVERTVRARYRARAALDDPPQAEIVEEYSLSEDGRSLLGTVTVTFLQDGQPRGGYVLHRRFERQP
jgi:hypothetical protein